MLKLYVWENVLYDYTSGIMFALAHNLEEAVEQIRKADSVAADTDLGKPYKVYEAPVGFAVWGGS